MLHIVKNIPQENLPVIWSGTNGKSEFCQRVLEESTTPFEKFSSNYQQGQQVDKLSESIYTDFWIKTLSSKGDSEKLEQFFRCYQLDKTAINQILAPAKLSKEAKNPEWFCVLNDVVNNHCTDSLNIEEGEDTSPFQELLLPFVLSFKKRLYKGLSEGESSLLSPVAYKAFERLISEKLSALCVSTLFQEFQKFREVQFTPQNEAKKALSENPKRYYYKMFVELHRKDVFQQLFTAYPMLARLLCQEVYLFTKATNRLLARLLKDEEVIIEHFELAESLGQITGILSDISDSHNGGEGVVIMEFSSGFKLVYKPRCLRISEAYGEFCQWINHQLDVKVKIISTLSRADYGWMEFIEHEACTTEEEVQDYYQRAGILLGIAHVLGASDFHAENVIASGADPVLIDHETLLQPQVNHHEHKVDQPQTEKQKLASESILRTHLLPMYTRSLGIPSDVISGFGSIQGHNHILLHIKSIANVNMDNMQMNKKAVRKPFVHNVPVLDQRPCPIHHYGEAVKKGFTMVYKLLYEQKQQLADEKGELRFFDDINLRFLFRSTQVYASILDNLLSPRYLSSATLYGIRLELLSRAFVTTTTKPIYWAVNAREREEMLLRDIPCFSFYSNDKILRVSEDETVSDYFKTSCIQAILNRLDILGDEDLAFQLKVIGESLAGNFNTFKWK